MATPIHAEAEEADSAIGKTQGGLPTLCQPAGGAGDRDHQPDLARLGELLCGRTFERLLFVCQRLGREEDPAASDASPEATRVRLETVE